MSKLSKICDAFISLPAPWHSNVLVKLMCQYGVLGYNRHCCAAAQVELAEWGCLDHRCSWQQLAAQLSAPTVTQRIAASAPSAILGVDWSSLPAYKAVAAALRTEHLPVPPFIYMNYRCCLSLYSHCSYTAQNLPVSVPASDGHELHVLFFLQLK